MANLLCLHVAALIPNQEENRPQHQSSVVYAVRYGYDEMGNTVSSQWMSQASFLRFLAEEEEKRNLLRAMDVNIRADAAWHDVRFCISGPEVGQGSLLVYTMSGTLILSHAFKGNDFSVDLSHLGRQLYLFRLTMDQNSKDFKLLKAR